MGNMKRAQQNGRKVWAECLGKSRGKFEWAQWLFGCLVGRFGQVVWRQSGAEGLGGIVPTRYAQPQTYFQM